MLQLRRGVDPAGKPITRSRQSLPCTGSTAFFECDPAVGSAGPPCFEHDQQGKNFNTSYAMSLVPRASQLSSYWMYVIVASLNEGASLQQDGAVAPNFVAFDQFFALPSAVEQYAGVELSCAWFICACRQQNANVVTGPVPGVGQLHIDLGVHDEIVVQDQVPAIAYGATEGLAVVRCGGEFQAAVSLNRGLGAECRGGPHVAEVALIQAAGVRGNPVCVSLTGGLQGPLLPPKLRMASLIFCLKQIEV